MLSLLIVLLNLSFVHLKLIWACDVIENHGVLSITTAHYFLVEAVVEQENVK